MIRRQDASRSGCSRAPRVGGDDPSEEQAVTLTVIKPETRTVNDRQYDVFRAVILGGALDSTQTRADLAALIADLDKEDAADAK